MLKSINWKVRIKSKAFWVAFIPAVLLLIQAVLLPFGISFDIEPLNSQLLGIINAVFVLLVILGIVTDPTTKGLKDSPQALSYSAPSKTTFGQPTEEEFTLSEEDKAAMDEYKTGGTDV